MAVAWGDPGVDVHVFFPKRLNDFMAAPKKRNFIHDLM